MPRLSFRSRVARRRLGTVLVLLLALAMTPARAQEGPTSLIADVIRVEDRSRLIASGNVEIISEGRRLTASRVSYDRETDRLDITGPMVLQDGPDRVLLADDAALDQDLQTGILRGARLVLDQQMQIAGAELERSERRFSDLRRVVASSCKVCEGGEDPLWEIRARRVIHDQEEQQIYFYDAQFRIAGLPVFFLPTMRVPDPTLRRANGILTPSVRTTDDLGPGFKLPYFITLGDHADLTLTPYIALDYTQTIEARYRQAFRHGEIELNGAMSRDSLLPGQLRSYLFAEGRFDLPRDFELNFDLQTTHDDSYLQDYDYSGKDRLDSSINVIRTRGREMIYGEMIHYRSLREGEENGRLPAFVTNLDYQRRLKPGFGGWLDLGLRGHSHARPSDHDIAGRDMATVRGSAAWQNHWFSDAGLRFAVEGLLNADLRQIRDDSRFDEFQVGLMPVGAFEISYPLSRTGADGANYQIEPIIQIVGSGESQIDTPNDDSTQVAFDTGNLLALNRFPGLDRYEEGLRANLALAWKRLDPKGWSLGVTLGKVYRNSDREQFPQGSGLAGFRSDWLAQVDLNLGPNLMLRSLSLFDSGFEPTLSETRMTWHGGRLDLSSSYVWQNADKSIDLDQDVSEVAIEASYDVTDRWGTYVDLRRDFVSERTNRAELGLSYRNECVRVDLSVLQRFRNTEDTEPTTSYGLQVTLAGFGEDDKQRAVARSCSVRG